jgi:hypothetical protein
MAKPSGAWGPCAEAARADLRRLVAERSPENLLAVVPDAKALFGDYLKTHPRCRLEQASGPALARARARIEPCRLAVVADTLEHMGKAQAQILIARLRDLYCATLYALVPIGADWPGLESHWEATELVALGLQPVKRYPCEGRSLHLYRFDLHDYKHTPDWLSPRHWANPEMWDKARW